MEQYYFDWFNIAKSKAMATFMRNFFLQFFYKVKVPKEVSFELQNKLQKLLQNDLDNNSTTYCSNDIAQKQKWVGLKEIENIIESSVPENLIFKLNPNSNTGYLYFVKENKPIAIGSFEFDYYGKLYNIFAIQNNVPMIDENGIRSIVKNFRKMIK